MQAAPPGYPGGSPAVAPTRPVLRPSGWWYLAAAGIALAGVVVATVLIVRAIVDMTDKIDDFDRAEMPVTLDVEIDDPGGYTIYHEVDGGSFSDGLWGVVEVSVTGPDGAAVDLDRYGSDVSYDFGGHDGAAIFSFEAEQAGTYVVDASMVRETSSGVDIVAVGPGLGRGLVGAIVAGLAVGLLACLAGVVLAIVVGVRRGRSRRAQAPPVAAGRGAPPGWGAQPPAGWGPPAPPAPPPPPASAPRDQT